MTIKETIAEIEKDIKRKADEKRDAMLALAATESAPIYELRVTLVSGDSVRLLSFMDAARSLNYQMYEGLVEGEWAILNPSLVAYVTVADVIGDAVDWEYRMQTSFRRRSI